jgi:hypothetical protein
MGFGWARQSLCGRSRAQTLEAKATRSSKQGPEDRLISSSFSLKASMGPAGVGVVDFVVDKESNTADQQTLIFAGKQLECNTMHLNRCMQIFAKTSNGKTITLYGHTSEQLEDGRTLLDYRPRRRTWPAGGPAPWRKAWPRK